MKKILPFLILLGFVVSQTYAQIPFDGYTLKGSPVNTTGWTFPPNVTFDQTATPNDEIILVQNANDIGFIKYAQTRKLFFCDSTTVEFDFKHEPNSNGGTDGFTFWALSTGNGTHIASPGLGMPMNSTGHAVIFDLFDNDNNQNNPIIGARQYTAGNYVEGSTNGILTANRDSTAVPGLGAGIWHRIKLLYKFNVANATNVTLDIYIDNVLRWTGLAFNTLPNMNTTFGFSATNGTNNFSKLSIRDVSIHPHPLPTPITVPIFCTDQLTLPFVYPQGGFGVWYESLTGAGFSGNAPTINVDEVDTFTYVYGGRVITQNQFCYGDRTTLDVIVYKSPEIEFDFTKVEGCGADTIDFVNLSREASIYKWNFGDGSDSVVFETNHIFNGAGRYNVVLRGENDFCVDSTSKTIVLENPFDVNFTISKDSICQNGFIEFANRSRVSDKNNIPTIWRWDFGTANWDTLLTENPPTKFYFRPGVYDITLKVTNGLPCTDSMTKTVVVDPYPSLRFTRIDTAICVGDNLAVEGSVGTEGLKSLTWNFGDGSPLINQGLNITKAYDAPGVYTITAEADYRICPDTSFSRQVLVNAIPKINLPKDTVLCYLGQGFEIGNLIPTQGASYVWSTGDTTDRIRITNPGTYTARITHNGCSATDDFTVNKDCYINIPNAFSPDGDGNNDTFIPRNQSEQSIKKFKMSIFNRLGQIVFETENASGSGWDGRFNGVEQPFGVYVYTIDVEFANGNKEAYHGNVTLIR